MSESSTLFQKLREYYFEADLKLQRKFQRSLPFADALFDRWERAKMLGFGKGTSIYNSAAVFGDVRVGDDTWIGPFTLLDGSGGGLSVGSSVCISAGVHIYTHDTVSRYLSGLQEEVYKSPVYIGNQTYIGAHAIIRAGVTIGAQCVIGANSFVTEDVPDRTIIAGTPGCKIGVVTEQNGIINLMYGKS